jgi:hypothetical protein
LSKLELEESGSEKLESKEFESEELESEELPVEGLMKPSFKDKAALANLGASFFECVAVDVASSSLTGRHKWRF